MIITITVCLLWYTHVSKVSQLRLLEGSGPLQGWVSINSGAAWLGCESWVRTPQDAHRTLQGDQRRPFNFFGAILTQIYSLTGVVCDLQTHKN